jgi:hypothetical protein
MPVVSIAGSEFTVQVASVAYSAQVTSGTITQTSTITRTRTLGGGNAFTQTDLISALAVTFLFDGDSGMYNALENATTAGTSLAVTIDDGTNTAWTGAEMYVESVEVSYDATGVATATASLTGTLAIS